MPALDSYLVTLGVKGQDVVLATMAKIRDKGKNLSKTKTAVDLATKTTSEKIAKFQPGGKTKVSKMTAADVAKEAKTKAPAEIDAQKNVDKKKNKDNEDNNKKFGKAVDKFGATSATLAHGASRLDPISAINTGLAALGKISIAGIPFSIAEAAVNIASNTVAMAKQNTAANYALVQRNATADYYGSQVSFAKPMPAEDQERIAKQNNIISVNEKKRDNAKYNKSARGMYQGRIDNAQDEKSRIENKNASGWSNAEQASLRMTLGASYGKIQAPLADALKEFTQGTKYDPSAVSRVASGNWASTGTDTGWMLQQISDSFAGLPPSIAQALQAAMIKQYGASEMQKAPEAEQHAQRVNADFQNADERQVAAIAAAINKNYDDLFNLNEKINGMQAAMVSAGAGVAVALNFVADQIKAMSAKIKTGN